jgi:hypothetical protein
VDYVTRALATWREHPAIEIIGSAVAKRLPIVSLMFRYGGRYLHHGFVVALLNDLFGIQARGGCSQGGMLMGLSPAAGQLCVERAAEGWLSLEPGWTRVSFSYFMGELEFRYIVAAVQLVGALMPRYDFDPRSGLWTHRTGPSHELAELGELQVDGREVRWPATWPTLPETALEQQLLAGREQLELALVVPPHELDPLTLPPEVEQLRWFQRQRAQLFAEYGIER